MRTPSRPTKPYPPYKPSPPEKYIEESTAIGDFSFEQDCLYDLKSFEDFVREKVMSTSASDEYPSTVKFSFEVIKEPTYYDEHIISLNIRLFTTAIVPNKKYDQLMKYHQESLIRYELDLKKYKSDMIKFNAAMIKFEEEYDIYQLEQNKKAVATLSKKIAAKGKKK